MLPIETRDGLCRSNIGWKRMPERWGVLTKLLATFWATFWVRLNNTRTLSAPRVLYLWISLLNTWNIKVHANKKSTFKFCLCVLDYWTADKQKSKYYPWLSPIQSQVISHLFFSAGLNLAIFFLIYFKAFSVSPPFFFFFFFFVLFCFVLFVS